MTDINRMHTLRKQLLASVYELRFGHFMLRVHRFAYLNGWKQKQNKTHCLKRIKKQKTKKKTKQDKPKSK